ncbi:hypothetical protein LCGC14_1849640 [marine sediment metagenome]|uniref:Uncharacterized protein n=1 Tax=marine sediment metagenome TaxID=412755 RepID=A0A0F9GAZ2_9ZZZZ
METLKEKSAATKTVVGGGVGGAIAVLIILFGFPEMAGPQAAIGTAALGTVCSWLIRYLPAPRR